MEMRGEGTILKQRWIPVLLAVAALLVLPASAIAGEPPKATTGDVEALTDETVRLTGKVNPEGGAVSLCRFEYGTTEAYGATAPCTPASLGTGIINVLVTADVDSLEPGVTYHYRLVAAGPNGATNGDDRTFTTTGSTVCPNVQRRVEQGILAIQLPNCMALEQVSPPQKLNQRALSPIISADGGRIAFYSLAALADTPGNLAAVIGDRYVATRFAAGWKSAPTSPPSRIRIGWTNARDLVRSFDPSLTRWFVLGSSGDNSEIRRGLAQMFRGGLGGAFDPLSPHLVPLAGEHRMSNVVEASLQAASADHSHAFFTMGDLDATYLPGDPVPSAGADRNVYLAKLDESGQPSLELAARDEVGSDAGTVWGGACGIRVGGSVGTGAGATVVRNQGAVSQDGRRVYISTRPAQLAEQPCSPLLSKLRILERLETPAGPDIREIVESECQRAAPEPACKSELEANGDDLYQGASVDRSKVYFMTNRQLADSDLDGTARGTASTTSGSAVLADVVTVTGAGTLTTGSTEVTDVEAVDGVFYAGQAIRGTGIPANATVVSVDGDTLRLSDAATAGGTQSLEAGPQPFAVGMTVSGPGIPSNSKVTAINGMSLTLDKAATASAGGVTIIDATASFGCSTFTGTAGCDLYLLDTSMPAGERLTQVSAGEPSDSRPVVGYGANVYGGTVAISTDGTRVYFVAAGVLTDEPNPAGARPSDFAATAPKAYVWDADGGKVRFIGALASTDFLLWAGPGSPFNDAYSVPNTGSDATGGEIGGDGRVLAFRTAAALTVEDVDVQPDVYRYDAAANPPTLLCVSCHPGEANVEVKSRASDGFVIGTAYAEANRWVSEDGTKILIRTDEGLIRQDTNEARDDYLWQPGRLTMLPGTTPPRNLLPPLGETPPVLSHGGDQVAFNAFAPLLPSDIDTAPDVYVARVGGGFAFPPTPGPGCTGEGCQGPASPAPSPAQAGTVEHLGRGNVKSPQPRKRCGKGKRRVKRNGVVRCVKRGKVRKRSSKHRRNRQPRKRCGKGKRRVKRNGVVRCVKRGKVRKRSSKHRRNRHQGNRNRGGRG